ncbi:Nn.00g058940.m01.CDS01 [Neocucurbitaria sp. VM-36]
MATTMDTQQARNERTTYQGTSELNDLPVGLNRLPLELRNEIYKYIVPDLAPLTIPTHFEGSALTFLTQRLPLCIVLNHQIYEEVAMAYYRRTMLYVERITVPSAETLLLQTPDSIAFKGIRYLEFTRPQGGSESHRSPYILSPPVRFDKIHAALSRCPELRTLTMTVTAALLLTTDQGSTSPRLRTMEEIEESTSFTGIIEHQGLQSLQLRCNDAHRHAHKIGKDYRTLFEPFAQWLMRRAYSKGSNLSFNIKICPSVKYNDRDPELSWHTSGYITSYWYQDFFG